MRRTMLAALAFLFGMSVALCQSPESPNSQIQQTADVATFRITTREVSVDVIALRERNQPVLDLTAADLQVSEAFSPESERTDRRHSGKAPQGNPGIIKSLHIIDPNAPQHNSPDSSGGLGIAASCLERSTPHYRIAFRPGPDGWHSGNHLVFVSTKRPGVRLYYRHRYYVGLTEPPAKPPLIESEAIEKLLFRAACYYPDTPPSISLRARLIETGRTDVLRYSVSVDANALSFLTLGDEAAPSKGPVERHVELDYGICTFDTSGQPIKFFRAPLVKNLNSADYARALDRGFPHTLELPVPEHLGVTRFVVRDRATGNLGAVDVAHQNTEPAPEVESGPTAERTAADLKILEKSLNGDGVFFDWQRNHSGGLPEFFYPPHGPIGSFGSIVPAQHSFCGDVYELPSSSKLLPDFREFDPIGSIYTPTLDVPAQIFDNTSGIPGVTPRTNLFGIDYHGVLRITEPGDYKFLMLSDDGAILRVDDKKVIDLDGLHSGSGKSGHMHLEPGSHPIEVLYYQGAVNSVALELWVMPPGASEWKLLDLNDYAEASTRKDTSEPTR